MVSWRACNSPIRGKPHQCPFKEIKHFHVQIGKPDNNGVLRTCLDALITFSAASKSLFVTSTISAMPVLTSILERDPGSLHGYGLAVSVEPESETIHWKIRL